MQIESFHVRKSSYYSFANANLFMKNLMKSKSKTFHIAHGAIHITHDAIHITHGAMCLTHEATTHVYFITKVDNFVLRF